jgi:N-acyl amino acid synthase of PEP-CTERM/exosortase system
MDQGFDPFPHNPPFVFQAPSYRFVVVAVDTPVRRMESHHLRYLGYSLENPFEPPNEDEMDPCDPYDRHASHFMVWDAHAKRYIATVRVIPPCDGKTELPVHPVFQISDEYGFSLRDLCRPENSIEISRFVVSKTRVRQALFHAAEGGGLSSVKAEALAIGEGAMLALIASSYRLAVEKNIPHCCSLMVPALAKRLKSLGIAFKAVGREIEYHKKKRQIFYISTQEFAQAIPKMPEEARKAFLNVALSLKDRPGPPFFTPRQRINTVWSLPYPMTRYGKPTPFSS